MTLLCSCEPLLFSGAAYPHKASCRANGIQIHESGETQTEASFKILWLYERQESVDESVFSDEVCCKGRTKSLVVLESWI